MTFSPPVAPSTNCSPPTRPPSCAGRHSTSLTTRPTTNRHHHVRAELLGALREVYDGSWSRDVGADGGRHIEWQGKAAVIAGCTTAIDSAHGVMSVMGERFLLVRMPEADGIELAGAALHHFS